MLWIHGRLIIPHKMFWVLSSSYFSLKEDFTRSTLKKSGMAMQLASADEMSGEWDVSLWAEALKANIWFITFPFPFAERPESHFSISLGLQEKMMYSRTAVKPQMTHSLSKTLTFVTVSYWDSRVICYSSIPSLSWLILGFSFILEAISLQKLPQTF